MFNGANILKVFRELWEDEHSSNCPLVLLVKNQRSQYLGEFRLMVCSTRNDRKCMNICWHYVSPFWLQMWKCSRSPHVLFHNFPWLNKSWTDWTHAQTWCYSICALFLYIYIYIYIYIYMIICPDLLQQPEAHTNYYGWWNIDITVWCWKKASVQQKWKSSWRQKKVHNREYHTWRSHSLFSLTAMVWCTMSSSL